MNARRALQRRAVWLPVVGTLAVGFVYLAWAYVSAQGRVEALFYVGQPGPQGWSGYDGQFVYAMARDLNPERVAPLLDVPAYRYQRVLLPLLARVLSRGQPLGILLAVWALNGLAHALGTALWARWLAREGHHPLWALLYGLWPGLLLAWRLGLPDPLAYGLALSGWLLALQGRAWAAWGSLLASVMAKEVTLLFLPAAIHALWQVRGRTAALGVALGVALPWGVWQVWLWKTFGQPGLGSGGGGATAFPLWPLGGLVQAARTLPLAWVLAYGLVLGPAFLLPLGLALRGLVRALRGGRLSPWEGLLAWHTGAMLWLPMSSWEPLAVMRLATGFLVAFWSWMLAQGERRWLLRLLPFWAAWGLFALAR